MKKCGLYLRVSTEEQAAVKEGSLKAQRIRLEALVKSKNTMEEKWRVARVYTEEGYSGKDLNRPQMQILLNDLQQSKINVVMCTRIDRITRSLLDFYSLYKTFKQHDVDFICLDDYFDTSSPIGRMALKMILIFAELEREQVSDRTKKCLRTRAMRGLWNGSYVLGYDIDSGNPGFLKVNKSESKIVNYVFRTYHRIGTIQGTRRHINNYGLQTKSYVSRKGVKHTGKIFYSAMLSHILRNKLYIGMIEINKKTKHKEQTTLPPEQKYQAVLGKHKPIVSRDLFDSVQAKLTKNHRKRSSTNPERKYFFLLGGLFYCDICGFPMKRTWSKGHGGTYYYYTCICRKKYVRADEIDKKIISEVRKHVFGTFDHTNNSNINIIDGSMEKHKLIQFVRRLALTRRINQRNILKEIIRKVYCIEKCIYIELH